MANEDYAEKSAEEVASAIVSAAEKQLSNYQVYHDMTLAEEAAFWDEMRQKVAEGTQARIDADKKYFDAKKKLDSQILSVEKKYSDSVSQVYQDLSKNINDAWDNYHDQVTLWRILSVPSLISLRSLILQRSRPQTACLKTWKAKWRA